MLTTIPKMNDFFMWPAEENRFRLELVQVIAVVGDVFSLRYVRTLNEMALPISFKDHLKDTGSPARMASNTEIVQGWQAAQKHLLTVANTAEKAAKAARQKANEARRAAENFIRRLQETAVPA